MHDPVTIAEQIRGLARRFQGAVGPLEVQRYVEAMTRALDEVEDRALPDVFLRLIENPADVLGGGVPEVVANAIWKGERARRAMYSVQIAKPAAIAITTAGGRGAQEQTIRFLGPTLVLLAQSQLGNGEHELVEAVTLLCHPRRRPERSQERLFLGPPAALCSLLAALAHAQTHLGVTMTQEFASWPGYFGDQIKVMNNHLGELHASNLLPLLLEAREPTPNWVGQAQKYLENPPSGLRESLMQIAGMGQPLPELQAGAAGVLAQGSFFILGLLADLQSRDFLCRATLAWARIPSDQPSLMAAASWAVAHPADTLARQQLETMADQTQIPAIRARFSQLARSILI